jgi:diguanylate cyclase (GGDEF)-like protein/PAS domain S-box-containing protein
MNPIAVALLGLETLLLALLVLGLFWLRRYMGLAPLYAMIGVFQPLQVILATSTYIEVAPGWPLSPGALMFSATLLGTLAVYIREDIVEARRVTSSVLVANIAMVVLLYATGWQMASPATLRLLEWPPELFAQGARVTVVGTLVLVADVALLLALYASTHRVMARHPLMRAWLTLTAVLVFDAIVFTTGVFFERPDYTRLLATGIASKFVLGAVFASLLVVYLRWVDHVPGSARAHHSLHDFFHATTWRDRYEHQADEHARERNQVFERITDAFVALDSNWRYTYVNRKAAGMFGRSAEELVGRHIWEEFPEGRDEPFAHAYREAMHDQTPRSIEAYYPPYDRWFENRIYPSRDGLTIYFHDVTERVRMHETLVRRANTHELTGLPNRQALLERIDSRIREQGDTARLAVIVLNLDRLHHVNATLGYGVGDRVMTGVARRLEGWATRRAWTVGWIGGDEFLLFGDADAPASLPAIAREAIDVLTPPYEVGLQTVHLTASAGVSWCPDAGCTASGLLEQADLAVNHAKQRGRGQIGLFSTARAADVRERLQLDTQLRVALADNVFRLHYQPLVDAMTGRIVAAEVLMRWTDGVLGPVGPARFIPVAEETGAIVQLGQWALRNALADLRAWEAAGIPLVPVSVNVSPVQMHRPEFVREVAAALAEGGLPPRLLKLEITESALMLDDDRAAVEMLAALKGLGVSLSLDDFGTGYSSLGRLHQLPIDELKIDRSFVAEIDVHGPGETLCKAIVAMGRTLDCHVVAEGVETPAQARFLAASGCQSLQGYLYSRPVPAPAFADLLACGGHLSSATAADSRVP